MGAGTRKQAFANVGAGQGAFGQGMSNAANVYAGLEPQQAAMAAHPQGMTPQQMATANTAAQQSAGGGTSGAIGAGRLYTARTGNTGAAKEAIGQGVRGAGQNLSNAALETQLANTALQQKQQQAALAGQQGLYGTTLKGAEEGLGLSNQALQGTEYNPMWQTLDQMIQSGGQIAAARAGRA